METKEAREILQENFDEITHEKYYNNEKIDEYLFIRCKDGVLYFKPKEKFPKVFEEIDNLINKFIKKWCGNMLGHLLDDDENDGEELRNNIKKLFKYQAIKLSQELRGKK